MVGKSFVLATAFAISAAFGLIAPAPALANFGCDDEGGLCIDGNNGAKWASERTTSAKERGKQSTKTAGTLSVSIDGGRGSLFINGRYAGTAPLDRVSIPSGANDRQVRDGGQILASGVLTVPKSGDVSVTVRHD